MSDAYCTHQLCPGHRGLARCPSETCLPESYQNKNCCARLTDSIDEALPSCAQRKKERAAAFHAIKELRWAQVVGHSHKVTGALTHALNIVGKGFETKSLGELNENAH